MSIVESKQMLQKGSSYNNDKRSSTRRHNNNNHNNLGFSFTLYFRCLSYSIVLVTTLLLTCSFLYSIHVSPPTYHTNEKVTSSPQLSKRKILDSTSDPLRYQLDQIKKLLDTYQTTAYAYASFARKQKLENSKQVRSFMNLSSIYTELVNKVTYRNLFKNEESPIDPILLKQFEKEVKENIKATRVEMSKMKESYDLNQKINKLRDTNLTLYEEVARLKKVIKASELSAAVGMPRSLHCLSLKLMQAMIQNPDKYNTELMPGQLVFEDPTYYHYAIFSDNVLAASVVVNSLLQNAKDPWKHVVHIVTDKDNLASMQVMFTLKDHKGAHIEVKSVDHYKFLNSSYVPVLRQKESAELQSFYFGNESETSGNKYRNPKYLSIMNHLRFYLPEMYPTLDRILFLDDDVVVQKDLTALWEVTMDGMVNGAVYTCFGSFHRYKSYFNFSNSLIKQKLDPNACAWAYGMNIFYLDQWRKLKCTEEYHHWQNLNENRTLWNLGTLPPGLVTFYSTTKRLDKSWHVLGLGYNPHIRMDDIENAAVVHFNGNQKPWLSNAIAKFRPIWTKYVDNDLEFVQACNFGF